jgi:hypothetical protein
VKFMENSIGDVRLVLLTVLTMKNSKLFRRNVRSLPSKSNNKSIKQTASYTRR